jgi:Uma2 family endonuclease
MQAAPERIIPENEIPIDADDFEFMSPSGEIIARDVSWDDFMMHDEWERVEWVDGTVVKMPGIELSHDGLTAFLRMVFTLFLEFAQIPGRVFQDPVLIRLRGVRAGRSPDLMVLLPTNNAEYFHNYVRGVPDLIIEIVSPTGDRRDRVEKFREYEKAGVPEYWILDSRFQDAQFYQLGDDKEYERILPDENGVYITRILPQLRVPLAWFWRDPKPGILELVKFVSEMLDAPAQLTSPTADAPRSDDESGE